MGSPRSNIEGAFERLKDSITIEDAHQFESTSLKDVWVAVREIESSQRRRQCNQNIRRVEPLLRGMEKLGTAIDVLCNGTPFLPYAWAPIKFLLKIASQYRDIFEALVSAYAKIGSSLPRLDRYAEAFKDNAEFQKGLATVCGSIVDFHIEAYKLLNKRGWHILFLSLWRDYESRFSGIINNLQVQRDFIDGEAASFHILETKLEQERAQEATRIAQLQHSIAWLSIDDKDQDIEYERLCHRRHEETCRWIASERQMKEWTKDNTKNPVLWLNGKPGAGKSVMCSYTVRFLKRMRGIVTCYYFCNSKNPANICDQVLRTIALQLLRSNLDLASLITNQYVYCGVSCSMAQLRKLLPQMLEIVPQVRILVDGIDECSKESQKSILKEIQSICLSPLIKCKIIFSSRKDHYINEKLSGKPQISLDKREEVETDILLYVKHKMKRLPTSNRALIDKVEEILVEKANGMFLWVRLVVEELRYCFSESYIEERATALPRGLDQAYQRILQRIMTDKYTCSLSVKILEWMACSHRNLKSYEVLDGIAFRPGFPLLTSKGKIDKAILNHCQPLIEDGPSNTLDFVHFSAKEYILKAKYYRDGSPFINVENAYFNIAFSCTAYLNTCVDLISNEEIYRAELVVQGLHGLQLYANQYWHRHFITYASFCAENKLRISEELVSQLSALLQLQKNSVGDHKSPPLPSPPPETLNLDILNLAPLVRQFILELISFRDSLSPDNISDRPSKSTENTPTNPCDTDPTHLSTIRNNYLSASEALLSQHAHHMFPTIDQNEIANFAETYGGSAFVCRILRCPFSTDGFSTPKQRDNHELLHRPKLRCGNTNCFSMGFSTRSQLNRHNEKYHPVEKDATSLVDAIRSLNIKSSPTPQAEKKVNASSNLVGLQQNTNSGASNSTRQIQQLIRQTIEAQTGPIRGWQNQLLIQERMGLVFNIIGNFRLACRNQEIAPPLNKMIETAMKYEKEAYETSRDKVGYRAAIDLICRQLLEQRSKNQPQMENKTTPAEKMAVPHSSTLSLFGNSQSNEGNPQQRTTDPRLNHPMFQGMNHEQRQKMTSLPPDKLDKIFTQWNVQIPQLGKQGDGPKRPIQRAPGRQSNSPTNSLLAPSAPKVSQPSKFPPYNTKYTIPNGQVSESSLPYSGSFNPMYFDFGPTVNAAFMRHQVSSLSHIVSENPGLPFVCDGYLESRGRWGCGTRFSNMLELGEHFQSRVGQKCTRLPMEEDLRKQQIFHATSNPPALDSGGLYPMDQLRFTAGETGFQHQQSHSRPYGSLNTTKHPRPLPSQNYNPTPASAFSMPQEFTSAPAAVSQFPTASTANILGISNTGFTYDAMGVNTSQGYQQHSLMTRAPINHYVYGHQGQNAQLDSIQTQIVPTDMSSREEISGSSPYDGRNIATFPEKEGLVDLEYPRHNLPSGQPSHQSDALSKASAQAVPKTMNVEDRIQFFEINGDLSGMDIDVQPDMNPQPIQLPPEKDQYFPESQNAWPLPQSNQVFEPSTNMPPFSRPSIPDGGISTRSGPGLQAGLAPGGNGHRLGLLDPTLLSGPGEIDDHFRNEHHLREDFPAPYQSNLRSGLTPPGGKSRFPQPSSTSEAPFKALANGGSLPTILEPHSTVTNAVPPARNQLSRKRGHESLKEPFGGQYRE